MTVNVTLTVGTGGTGSGSLTVTPGSFTLSYTTGSGVYPAKALTLSTTAGAATVSATATSDGNWLLINGSTFWQHRGRRFLCSFGGRERPGDRLLQWPDRLPGQPGQPDHRHRRIVGERRLLGRPHHQSFGAGLQLSGGGGSQNSSLFVTSTTGGTFTATPSVNWITTSVSTGNLASNTQGTVTVTVTPGGLSNNTYTGNVTVNVGGQQQSIPVTLTVGTGGGGGGGNNTVAPSSIQLSWQTGTPPNTVNRPQIVIAGTTGSWSSTVSTAQGGNWLSLNPTSGSIPAQPTVLVDPSGLTQGTYSGTVAITTPNGTQNVTVTLSVTSGAVLSAQPGSLIFSAQTGGSTPAGQSVFFSTSDIALNNSLDLTGLVTASVPWLSVTTFQKSIQVFADPSGLTGGVYSGTVTVSPSGLTSLVLPVVLVIDSGTGGGGSGPLIFSPASLSFTAATGSSPSTQSLSVTSNTSTSYSVTSNQTWLTVSPASGSTPSNLTVSVASSNLAAGSYNGTLTFNPGTGSTQTVAVALTVTGTGGGGNPGNVTTAPSSLTFTSQTGTGTLPVQAVQINSASGNAPVTFTVTSTTVSGGSWLSTSVNAGVQGSTPLSLSVNANITGLAAGTYQGNVRITPTGGTVKDIPVTLTITAPASVSATPTNLTFTYRAGGAIPAAQTVAVSGAGSALGFTAAATSTGNWLEVSPASGTTPGNVSVTVDPTGVNASSTPYTGTVTVAGSGGAPGSTTINVSLTVTAPLPTISKATNAASYQTASISPGEIITLFGTDLGPATAAGLALDSTGKVATSLAGVQVLINGFPGTAGVCIQYPGIGGRAL